MRKELSDTPWKLPSYKLGPLIAKYPMKSEQSDPFVTEAYPIGVMEM